LKTIAVIGLLLGIGFVIIGFTVEIPSRQINTYSVEQYVGGDAYNYQIEASILGGEIAGANTSRATYFSVGALISLISSLTLAYKPVCAPISTPPPIKPESKSFDDLPPLV